MNEKDLKIDSIIKKAACAVVKKADNYIGKYYRREMKQILLERHGSTCLLNRDGMRQLKTELDGQVYYITEKLLIDKWEKDNDPIRIIENLIKINKILDDLPVILREVVLSRYEAIDKFVDEMLTIED